MTGHAPIGLHCARSVAAEALIEHRVPLDVAAETSIQPRIPADVPAETPIQLRVPVYVLAETPIQRAFQPTCSPRPSNF